MHTSGIAGEDQLSINHSIGENKLVVQPGTALDDEGQEIVLVNAETITLNADIGISEEGTYALYVEYNEKPTDPSPDPGLSDLMTRVQETPRFRFEKLTGSPPFNYPPLTLASVDVDKDGRLKAAPDTGMRKMVGTKMGFTGAFDALTAKSLTLREPGAIISPMWQVRLSLNDRSPGVSAGANLFDTPKEFETAGGSVMMFATVSVLPKPPDNVDPGKPFVIGIDIAIDGVKISSGEAPSIPSGATKPTAGTSFTTHATISTMRWISPMTKGRHKLMLQAKANTTLTECDFYNVTIVEMPFTAQE
jgi:hypothetical protein